MTHRLGNLAESRGDIDRAFEYQTQALVHGMKAREVLREAGDPGEQELALVEEWFAKVAD